MRISDWSSDVCSSDLVAGGQRAGDRGRIVIFEAALGLAAVGADIEARDAKIGGFAVDFIGRVRRIILAVARVGLVFAIVEIIDRIIGVIFGRVAVAERGFQIGRAHVWTPVTNAHLVCRLLLEKKKYYKMKTQRLFITQLYNQNP